MAQNRAKAIREYTSRSQSCKKCRYDSSREICKKSLLFGFLSFFFVEDDEGRVCLRAREREIIMTNIRKYIESKRSYRLCYRCYLRMMNTSWLIVSTIKYQSVYTGCREIELSFSLLATRWNHARDAHLFLVPFQGDIGPTGRHRRSSADGAKA